MIKRPIGLLSGRFRSQATYVGVGLNPTFDLIVKKILSTSLKAWFDISFTQRFENVGQIFCHNMYKKVSQLS